MYYDVYASGKRIQELRKTHKMTQVQLAEVLNISLDHLKKIESGQRGCSVDLLINLSELFDESLDFLVLGKVRPNSAAQKKIQSLIDGLEALKNTL